MRVGSQTRSYLFDGKLNSFCPSKFQNILLYKFVYCWQLGFAVTVTEIFVCIQIYLFLLLSRKIIHGHDPGVSFHIIVSWTQKSPALVEVCTASLFFTQSLSFFLFHTSAHTLSITRSPRNQTYRHICAHPGTRQCIQHQRWSSCIVMNLSFPHNN